MNEGNTTTAAAPVAENKPEAAATPKVVAAAPAPAAPVVVAATGKKGQPMLPAIRKQMDMFASVFKAEGELAQACLITNDETGSSIKVLKRSGKGTSLASVSGKTGEELARWERVQTDALLVKQVAALNAAVASGLYTGGSLRIRNNGSLGINAKFVGVKTVTLDTASREQVLAKAKALGIKIS